MSDGESSEDMPLADLREESTPASSSKRRRSVVSYAEDDDEDEGEVEFEGDDDDSEDDDLPLSSLASPKKKKATSPKKKKAAAPAKKKPKATATKKKASTTSSSSSKSSGGSTDYKSASAALYGSECQKGLLIQRLLCRWWYAIKWPNPASIPNEPPEHYDPLDGFPGVYVCTEGDEVGTIQDFRNKDESPNFANLAKKTSEELQMLLIKALMEQREQLIQAEGSGTPTEKELDTLLKWAKKVKPPTADKEAVRVLKAAKMTLD